MTVLLAGIFGGAVAVLAHAFLATPYAGTVAQKVRAEALNRWRSPLAQAVELLRVDELKVVATQAAVALVLAALMMIVSMPTLWPAFLPVALVAGYAIPVAVVRRRVSEYRAAVRNDLADAVEFLDLHLAAGYNVPQALAGTCDLTTGPLRRELQRMLARVAGGMASGAALRDFGQRADDVDVMTVTRHIAVAWTLATPGQEVFAGLGDTFRRLEEAKIIARTRKLPALFSLLIGLGLLNLLLLVGAPAFAWLLATLAQTR